MKVRYLRKFELKLEARPSRWICDAPRTEISKARLMMSATTTSAQAQATTTPKTLTTMAAKVGMLSGKKRGRRTVKVKEHEPRGVHKVGSFPRRRDFEEGEAGGQEHLAAMRIYTADFAGSHGQDKNFKLKLRQVAHFGQFLVNEKYGEFVNIEKQEGGDVLVVALKKDGVAKRPPAASVIEYLLVQVIAV